MGFDKKIKQLNGIKNNLGKFTGESALRHHNILEDAITEDQLHGKGEDGLGKSLGEYADSSKFFKSTIAGALGRDTRSDHITLRDFGDYHESIKVSLISQGIKIDSQPQKEDTNLIDKFGRAILFVNDQNLEEFRRPFLLDDLIDNIRAAL